MYNHRGKAIQAIQHVLDKEQLRSSDYALSLVLMLLFGEVSTPRVTLKYRVPANLKPFAFSWKVATVRLDNLDAAF